jgi:D-alanyl-D-alanine carboxypeptidase/D-alanyl-D-alanine-endopeptidase (penicillin-binding protein 4)
MRTVSHRPVRAAVVIGLAAIGVSVAVAAPASASPRSQLRHQVSASFRGSTARDVHYNVQIAGGPTLTRHSNLTSRPASNEKLITTETLLAQVGPSFEYRTTFYVTAPVSDGVEDGDLIVVGGGDPTLTSSELGLLGKDLHQAGLHKVTGNLVIDDSRYNHWTTAPGWKHGFLPDESGPIDAFSVDSDAHGHSSSYLADPTLANAKILRKELHSAHIAISGSDKAGRLPADATLLRVHRSGALSQIVRETLTVSDNYNAEMMLREAGYQASGEGTRTSGIAAIRAEAKHLHVKLGRIEDGSGLSYLDAESPRDITRWLHAIHGSNQFHEIYTSVPTSCRTGTLEFRLCGAHVASRVHAKTGTLDHDVALSGWTHTRSGRLVTFSFLLSKVHSTATAEAHLDAAVSRIARYR